MILVTRLNTVFSDPDLPVIPAGDIKSMSYNEVFSSGHWLLGATAYDSYQNKVEGGAVLTENGITPTFTRNGAVITSASTVNTLFKPSPGSSYTIAVVYRSTSNGVAMGASAALSTDGVGPKIMMEQQKLKVIGKYGGGIDTTSLDLDTAIGSTDYVFHLITVSSAGQFAVYSPHLSGIKYTEKTASTPFITEWSEPLAVGPMTASAFFDNTEVAEIYISNRYFSEQEASEAYQRSKYRMSQRGITI